MDAEDYIFLKKCAGKKAYGSFFLANHFLQNSHCDTTAVIYKCDCGFFHIGGNRNKKGEKNIKHKTGKYEENIKQHKRKHKRFKY